jgi:hypothetical protein
MSEPAPTTGTFAILAGAALAGALFGAILGAAILHPREAAYTVLAITLAVAADALLRRLPRC